MTIRQAPLTCARVNRQRLGKHTGARVPFKATPLLLVPVLVKGKGPYDFVLDTGASATLLAPTLAEHLGLSATEEVPVLGTVTAGQGGRCVLQSPLLLEPETVFRPRFLQHPLRIVLKGEQLAH